MVAFKRAVKSAARLRMALAGPSGSGKTFTALTLATALAQGGQVAVIDTERGSASKYSDRFTFDVVELESYHPDRYIEAIQAAGAPGTPYTVLVIDSLSHAWNGPGGLLELVDSIAKRGQGGGNSYTAWKDVTPIQNRLIDAITRAPLHVIATMRSKTEYVLETNERGKQVPRKVGMAPIQRDGTEYEFDCYADMDHDNTMIMQKSRCPRLSGAVITKPDAHVAAALLEWLQGETVTTLEVPSVASGAQTSASASPKVVVRSLKERLMALGWSEVAYTADFRRVIAHDPPYTSDDQQRWAAYVVEQEQKAKTAASRGVGVVSAPATSALEGLPAVGRN